MDLAVLTSLLAAQPLIILSDSDTAPLTLAQISSAYSLECITIEPNDLLSSGLASTTANVVIVKDLQAAPRNVQIYAIELVRAKAKGNELFLLIALLPSSVVDQGPPYLTHHLNDIFMLAHTHDEEAAEVPDALSKDEISGMRSEVGKVKVSAEVGRYTHDIVSHLRLHRACGLAGGRVSSVATRQLGLLSRVLAVLNGLGYVTPSLVSMAARKVFLHRLVITDVEHERSMQWGSDREAVAAALKGATPESVVEEVLASVECPL